VTISPPTLWYPACGSYVVTGREPALAVPATNLFGVKMAAFKPSPKITWLKDETYRGDTSKVHEIGQGPVWMESEIPESPLYGDVFPTIAYNFWGDYVQTGTASTPTWTTSAAPLTPGAGPITVVSGASATSGTYIQVDTGVNAEIVEVGTGSTATSIVLNASTPLRFSHLASVAVVTVVAPFSHAFSQLNPGSSTGNATCQPPSNSFWHVNTPAGSGNFSADEYLYGVVTELTVSGKANGWTTWSAKVTSLLQQAPAQALTGVSLSAVKGIPAWRSTQSVAGTQQNQVTTWSATWTREMETVNTADGVQAPYGLLRGQIESKWKFTINPAVDESAVVHMTANDQPSLQWAVSNGGSGSGLVGLNINSALAAYEDVPLTMQKVAWGYECSGEFVGSSTYAGNSGGTTLSQMIVQNAIPVF
jgi:hypothetical protein